MNPLFIASKRGEHDGSRRVLAVGRIKGGSALIQIKARFGDLQASGTRPGASRQQEEGSGR